MVKRRNSPFAPHDKARKASVKIDPRPQMLDPKAREAPPKAKSVAKWALGAQDQ